MRCPDIWLNNVLWCLGRHFLGRLTFGSGDLWSRPAAHPSESFIQSLGGLPFPKYSSWWRISVAVLVGFRISMETPVFMSVRHLLNQVIDIKGPTVNVGGTIQRAGVLDWIKRGAKLTGPRHPYCHSDWLQSLCDLGASHHDFPTIMDWIFELWAKLSHFFLKLILSWQED